MNIDDIVLSLIENPEHIRTWQRKERLLKNTPAEFLKHKEFFTEDFVFSPDENIMVYADFPCEDFYPMENEPDEFKKATPHRHEFFELFYIYKGSFNCTYMNETYSLTPGSVWIFNCECAHLLYPASSDAFVFNIMVRKTSFLDTVLPLIKENDLFLHFFLNSVMGFDKSPCHMHFSLSSGDKALFYIEDIIKEYYEKETYSQSKMRLLYACLLIELSKKSKSVTSSPSASFSSEISEIISYISDHVRDVTLLSLSDKFHMTPKNLSRLIQKHTGFTFSDYLYKFKMEKAEYLLSESSLSIDNIADFVGYSQRSAFEKEFKKHKGLTPRQYRENF